MTKIILTTRIFSHPRPLKARFSQHNQQNATTMKSMKSAPTFISFSAVTTSSSYTNYETVSESNPGAQSSSQPYISPVYEGDDPILATASKKLFKKDATTRLKALNDILAVFQNDTTSVVVTGEDGKIVV